MTEIQVSGAILIGLLLGLPAAEKQAKFLTAARRGDVAGVQALLAAGVNVNARTSYGGTALAFASDKGHLEVVKILLKHKANVNAHDSFYNATPLTWAAMHDRTEIVKALLDTGATDADSVLTSAVIVLKLHR